MANFRCILYCLFIANFLVACNPQYETPDSALDAGRQFINSVYQGNFKRANQLICRDEKNIQLLKTLFEKDFRASSSNRKELLSKASIVILKAEQSINNRTIVQYKNAYNGQKATIVVLQTDKEYCITLLDSLP